MKDESDNIVDSFRGGEGAVATFMCEDPDASHDHASNHGVESVCHRSEDNTWEQRCIGVCDPCQATEQKQIPGYVAQSTNSGRAEAMFWNSIMDLLHSEFGNFVNIAIQIDVLGTGVPLTRWYHCGKLVFCEIKYLIEREGFLAI